MPPLPPPPPPLPLLLLLLLWWFRMTESSFNTEYTLSPKTEVLFSPGPVVYKEASSPTWEAPRVKPCGYSCDCGDADGRRRWRW